MGASVDVAIAKLGSMLVLGVYLSRGNPISNFNGIYLNESEPIYLAEHEGFHTVALRSCFCC